MLPQNAGFRITAIEPFSFYDAIFLGLDRILCMHSIEPHSLAWSKALLEPSENDASNNRVMLKPFPLHWGRLHVSVYVCVGMHTKPQYCFYWNSEILDIKMLKQGHLHDNVLKQKEGSGGTQNTTGIVVTLLWATEPLDVHFSIYGTCSNTSNLIF